MHRLLASPCTSSEGRVRAQRAQNDLQQSHMPVATHRSVDSWTQEMVTTQVLNGGGIATPAMQASEGVSVGASDGIMVVSCTIPYTYAHTA